MSRLVVAMVLPTPRIIHEDAPDQLNITAAPVTCLGLNFFRSMICCQERYERLDICMIDGQVSAYVVADEAAIEYPDLYIAVFMFFIRTWPPCFHIFEI